MSRVPSNDVIIARPKVTQAENDRAQVCDHTHNGNIKLRRGEEMRHIENVHGNKDLVDY